MALHCVPPQILVGLKPATATTLLILGAYLERFKRPDPDDIRDVTMKRKIIITRS